MKSVIVIVNLTILFFSSSFSQILPKKFWNTLQENKMVYGIPRNFIQTPVIKNKDVEYDFAITSSDKQLEIRYKIQPLLQQAQNKNSMSDAILLTMALNISGGKMVDTEPFPAQSVRTEFNADNGFTTMVPVNSEFGKGYKMCMINVIHKDNIADAFTFILFDDPQSLMKVLGNSEVFHALKFK